MYLLPSAIIGQEFSEQDASTSNFGAQNNPYAKFMETLSSAKSIPLSQMPKLQVFKKDGYFFALDCNALRLYQVMQTSGLCKKVHVDLVDKAKIPKPLWDAAGYGVDGGGRGRGRRMMVEGEEVGEDSDTLSDTDPSNDEEWSDGEDLFCPGCMEAFESVKQLTEHQIQKRHFGCLTCGRVFNSLKKLEEHKTSANHGSNENLATQEVNEDINYSDHG